MVHTEHFSAYTNSPAERGQGEARSLGNLTAGRLEVPSDLNVRVGGWGEASHFVDEETGSERRAGSGLQDQGSCPARLGLFLCDLAELLDHVVPAPGRVGGCSHPQVLVGLVSWRETPTTEQ